MCIEDLKRREDKKERDCEEVRSRNFVTFFIEYNKDKVLVDVATSLVVNHVNLGVLCLFLLCLSLCFWRSYSSKIIYKHIKEQITVCVLCMNAKLL